MVPGASSARVGASHLSSARAGGVRALLARLEHPTTRMEGREAAVLVPLFERDGEIHLVLTTRSLTVSTHQGQVAFPGGGRDESDADLLATALRETEEEIGLAPAAVEPLGLIATMPTYADRFVVAAYAASIEPPEEWIPNVHEIAEVFELPLRALVAARTVEWRQREAIRFQMPLFEVDGYRVWGFTAFVLARFLDLAGAVLR